MKKLIVTAFAGICALSVLAQGTISFNNFQSTVRFHVYAPNSASPSLIQIGNAATGDVPAGTTSWAGWQTIGQLGNGIKYGGNTTLASLLAAPGLNAAESSLQPAVSGGTTSFRSGTALLGGGILYGTTATFANLPADSTGGATLEMVAWDNSSGLYPTWALAKEAWLNGTIAAGVSGTQNLTATIGGSLTTSPFLPNSFRSFNLYMVPEPSSFALAGLGAAALLIFRRRK